MRRSTIGKRMRAKLRELKQQLRERMHDPVQQTGQWLKSVVQGYFNYHAVPGNIYSLGAFRDRVTRLWRRTFGPSEPEAPAQLGSHSPARRAVDSQPCVLHPLS